LKKNKINITYKTNKPNKLNKPVSDIAQDADINQKQAKEWLNILETLGIIFYLHPYSNNLLKRLVKTPKLYFYDTGLVCYLTKWSNAAVLESGAMSDAFVKDNDSGIFEFRPVGFGQQIWEPILEASLTI
jgi:predicted AAA+ superfamily ATPase